MCSLNIGFIYAIDVQQWHVIHVQCSYIFSGPLIWKLSTEFRKVQNLVRLFWVQFPLPPFHFHILILVLKKYVVLICYCWGYI